MATGTSTSGNTGVACTAVLVPHDYNADSVTAVSRQAQTAVAACRTSGVPPSGYVAGGNGPLIGPKQ